MGQHYGIDIGFKTILADIMGKLRGLVIGGLYFDDGLDSFELELQKLFIPVQILRCKFFVGCLKHCWKWLE